MIPDLPPNVSDEAYLEFYHQLAGNLSDQSTIHMNWHTHRQNPSVCWICDYYNLMIKVLALADRNISKSALDMVTELSSEDDSDSEIENDLNVNDEPDSDETQEDSNEE